jgi:hypothetical protein
VRKGDERSEDKVIKKKQKTFYGFLFFMEFMEFM